MLTVEAVNLEVDSLAVAVAGDKRTLLSFILVGIDFHKCQKDYLTMTMHAIIQNFQPISLEEMGGIRLMNRTDTKFVTSVDKLVALLQMAGDEYRVQEIDGKRNMSYATIYYDSKDYAFYNAHHDGHAGRQKVRVRSYVDSSLSFLEVKTKDNHGKTHKSRISASSLKEGEAMDFLRKNLRLDPRLLEQKIANRFHRVTLVNKAKTERLTIDTDLEFENLSTGMSCSLDHLAIIELKRDGLKSSPVLGMLRELRIHQSGFSKYCVGEALTNPGLRINRMKPRLQKLMKIV